MRSLPLTVYRALAEEIRVRAGLQFADKPAYSFERRLRAHLLEGCFARYEDYLAYLRQGSAESEAEWQRLVESLVVSETYFFRESYQLRAFEREVIPLFAKENQPSKTFSVWSAGCSTGEEAYTIAMLCAGHAALANFRVRVHGTDISRRSIVKARTARYDASAFRCTDTATLARWFDGPADGPLEVNARIRTMCTFDEENLLARAGTASFDAIFCRNVLFYLTPEARTAVLTTLYDALVPGGILLLGHADSLAHLTPMPTAFELFHLKEDLVYRRPIGDYFR
jgi:chemotaxis protein methyltransferase CheR